jgi:hypothetical protein
VPTELFELKVIVEADGWHDLSGLMTTVDRALDPHRQSCDGGRRWSVVASRLPAGQADDLRRFVDQWDEAKAVEAAAEQMSA